MCRETVDGRIDVATLINSNTGALLRTIGVGGNPVYGQPGFADGYLLVPTVGAVTGLIVFRP